MKRGRQPGFTLIELIMVMMLLAVIATMTVSYFRGATDAERWEETRQKMEAIKAAILGDPTIDTGGERNRFGYLGDMGRLPGNLTVLTAAEAPAYSFNTYLGIGAGWRGPYYNARFSGSYAVELDGWGRPFVYATTAITSKGADGATGGAAHDTDITIPIPVSLRLASVRGRFTDLGGLVPNEAVELWYPVNGTLTASKTTTDATGSFVFPTIPYGVRAIVATGMGRDLQPVAFPVDQPQVLVPASFLDRYGRSGVFLTGGILVGSSGILVTNPRSTSSGSKATTITLNYTVPPGAGNNLVLMAAASSEAPSLEVLINSINFGGSPMTLITSDYTGFSKNGYTGGIAMAAMVVTAGQKGAITTYFNGNPGPRLLSAYTMTDVFSATPETVQMLLSSCCDITGSVTTENDGAMVATMAHIGNPENLTPIGTGHTEATNPIEAGGTASAGATGYFLMATAGTSIGIGWSSPSTNRMGVILSAFTPLTRAVGITLRSTYRSARTLDYITVIWDGSTRVMRSVRLGTVRQKTPNVPSGTRIDINQPMQIAAGSTSTELVFIFDGQMIGRNFTVVLEWTTGEQDTIRFST